MKNHSEKEVLQNLARGDEFSYGLVFNVYYSRLYYFAQHYLADEESAKDVVQDVFSAVWKQHEKFAEVNDLSSWLYTLTKNLCLKKIDYLKVRQKHNDLLKYRQLNIVQDTLNDLDTSPVTFNEIGSIINQTLERLSPQCRQIFEMSRFDNLKNREIAEQLNLSQKTVEANITKALKEFKKSLAHYLPFVFILLR